MRHSLLALSVSAIASVLVAACGTPNATTGRAPSLPPEGIYSPLSAADTASLAAQRAAVTARLRSGYLYQVRGSVHTVDVAPGKLPVFHLGPGDHVEIALVPAPAEKYVLRGAPRTVEPMDFTQPPDCDDCGNNNPPTPSPQPTPPPNFGPCSSSGGATWYNSSSGAGGCTPRGNSQPLPCGTWTWVARGKGSLVVPGTGTFGNLDWVIDNGEGSCTLGYL